MENKTCGIIGYITWIGFIAAIILGDMSDAFLKHHLNQALALNIIGTVFGIIGKILGFIPVIRVVAGIVLGVLSLVMFIILVMGIISAANGTMKPLPIVGGVRIFK